MTEGPKKEKKRDKLDSNEKTLAIWGIGFGLVVITMALTEKYQVSITEMAHACAFLIIAAFVLYHFRMYVEKRRADANSNP